MTESLELAKARTDLANQRTYLAYMRTGFAIAAIAGLFKKWYISVFGVMMVVTSTIQYYYIHESIKHSRKASWDYHYVPLIYSILSLAVIALQVNATPTS